MGYILKQKSKVKYLTISSFEESGLVKHGFSTRIGGFSKAPYDTLNLGLKKDDDKATVMQNYRAICDALEIKLSDLVSSDQVHENDVYLVKKSDRGKGITKQSDIVAKDALITNEKNVALVTYYADCVPLFFLDTITPAIGLAHAGWRGTVKMIGQKTLYKMADVFGSNPKDILVGIGPCINKCCYEVDEPVVYEFRKTFNYWEKLVEKKSDNHWMLDLVLANRLQLENAGIDKSNISICEFCTSCRNDLFFSHRADDKKTGSLAAFIQLI